MIFKCLGDLLLQVLKLNKYNNTIAVLCHQLFNLGNYSSEFLTVFAATFIVIITSNESRCGNNVCRFDLRTTRNIHTFLKITEVPHTIQPSLMATTAENTCFI